MKIRNNKHVFVDSQTIAQGQPVRTIATINIPFQPDEMIIRTAVMQDDLDSNAFYVCSDVCGNGVEPICLVRDSAGSATNLDVHHFIRQRISGVYNFSVSLFPNATNYNAVSATGANFLVHLEFVEYEK